MLREKKRCKRLFIWLPLLLAQTAVVTRAAAEDRLPADALPRLPEEFGAAAEQPEALVTLSVDGRAGVFYDDNVLRSPTDEEGDFTAVIAPRLGLRSRTETYRWEASAEIEAGDYRDTSGNDYVDFDTRAAGAWQPSNSTELGGRVRFRDGHQPIGSFPDDPERAARDATDFRQGELAAELRYTPDRLFIEAIPELITYDYDNARRRDGTRIFNDDRDRAEFEQGVRVGYRVGEKLLPYGFGTYNRRSYEEKVDGVQPFDRDSEGFTVGAGVSYGQPEDATGFDARVGYLEQDYRAGSLPDVEDVAVAARASWQATPRLRLTGAAERSVEETTLDGASSYLETDVEVNARYAVRPNVDVYAEAGYARRDFQTDPAVREDREDDVYRGVVGLTWRLPSNLYVDAHYDRTVRDSTDPAVEYDSNTFNLGLGARF
jgi:opacity protein-like surface antigen